MGNPFYIERRKPVAPLDLADMAAQGWLPVLGRVDLENGKGIGYKPTDDTLIDRLGLRRQREVLFVVVTGDGITEVTKTG